MSDIELQRQDGVVHVWMNRPTRHNAFDERLISDLTDAFEALGADAEVRVVVLGGRGRSFSAGADLDWMRRLGAAGHQENLDDARRLARLFQVLSRLPQPTIARVHGAAIGGGMGLVAACDVAIGSTASHFATSEVRLGLIPAVIAPYVMRAIGERQCLRWFQTAARIDAARALAMGLLHECVAPEALDDAVRACVDECLQCGPQAQAAATSLIRAVANHPVDAALIEDTARRIAKQRATDEAKEGLDAFLSKRPPSYARPVREPSGD